MTVMLMSNPGLHLALLGNPRPKRKSKSKARSGFPSRKRYTQAVWRAQKRTGKRFKIKGGGRYVVKARSAVKHRGKRHHLRGIGWSGRLGGVGYRGLLKHSGARSYHKVSWTNPRRRKHHRKNPMKYVSAYVGALKRAPSDIMGTFKGPNKLKHIAFATGGALGTYALGGMVTSSLLVPALNKVGAGRLFANPIAKRVVGGLVPFTIGYVGSRFLRNPNLKRAVMVGGAIASLVEIAVPGMMQNFVQRITGASPAVAAVVPAAAVKGPVSGMDGLYGYVDSPAYQGTGGYVDSPAYQGTGEDVEGYVDSPAYQGTGADDDLAASGDDVMAGVDGYLTEGSKYMDSYLN